MNRTPTEEEPERYLDTPSASLDSVLEEIAKLLQISVSALESKPQDVREILRQIYLHSTMNSNELALVMRDLLTDGSLPDQLVSSAEPVEEPTKLNRQANQEMKPGIFYLSGEQRRALAKAMNNARQQEMLLLERDKENN